VSERRSIVLAPLNGEVASADGRLRIGARGPHRLAAHDIGERTIISAVIDYHWFFS
jgi:hypothetical protein